MTRDRKEERQKDRGRKDDIQRVSKRERGLMNLVLLPTDQSH